MFGCFFRGRIELGDVTHHNIKQLKRLNQIVFPVTYNEKFYKDVLEVGELAQMGKDVPFYSQLYKLLREMTVTWLLCNPSPFPYSAL